MQALRNATFLARLVLAWFALAMGAAIASPILKPQAVELICSGGAVKLLLKADDGKARPAGHTLDCPLCVALDAPPVAARGLAAAVSQAEHDLQPIPATRIAEPLAPPPARGPPAGTAA